MWQLAQARAPDLDGETAAIAGAASIRALHMQHDPRPARKHPSGSPARSGRSKRYGSSTSNSCVKRLGAGRTRLRSGTSASLGRTEVSGRSITPASESVPELVAGVTILSGHVAVVLLEAVGGRGHRDDGQHDADVDRGDVRHVRTRLCERQEVRQHVRLGGIEVDLLTEVA